MIRTSRRPSKALFQHFHCEPAFMRSAEVIRSALGGEMDPIGELIYRKTDQVAQRFAIGQFVDRF